MPALSLAGKLSAWAWRGIAHGEPRRHIDLLVTKWLDNNYMIDSTATCSSPDYWLHLRASTPRTWHQSGWPPTWSEFQAADALQQGRFSRGSRDHSATRTIHRRSTSEVLEESNWLKYVIYNEVLSWWSYVTWLWLIMLSVSGLLHISVMLNGCESTVILKVCITFTSWMYTTYGFLFVIILH